MKRHKATQALQHAQHAEQDFIKIWPLSMSQTTLAPKTIMQHWHCRNFNYQDEGYPFTRSADAELSLSCQHRTAFHDRFSTGDEDGLTSLL